MAIIFSSQANVPSDNIFGDVFNSFGIPGFPEPPRTKGEVSSAIEAVRDYAQGVVNKLVGKGETNYMGTGRQVVIGGYIEGGNASPVEEASVRQVCSQTPQISIIFKKRAMSSLIDFFNGILLDPAEKWMIRAVKRMVERKCQTFAEYERLAKIERMLDWGINPATILMSLKTDMLGESGDSEKFNSAYIIEKLLTFKQPVRNTTFYWDHDATDTAEFGIGTGAFEITSVTNTETNLDLDGNGGCSLSIEDPCHILFVTEEDIELSIRETSPETLQNTMNRDALNKYINDAQSAETDLSKSRKRRGMSEITFSVGLSGTTAVVDAIGFEINSTNYDTLPEDQQLDETEQGLFLTIFSGLEAYSSLLRLNVLQGQQNANLKNTDDMKHIRKQMRLYYLGKLIIQPMDTINIFIDGETRRFGEGEDITGDGDIFTLDGAIKTASSALIKGGALDVAEAGPDKSLLQQEYLRIVGNNIANAAISFDDFVKLRTLQISSENGTHVFGGLVKTASDRYDADSGRYLVNISADSNMEWLKLSRYNSQPSLLQNPGIIFDPFTPFKFKTDPATGLPTGQPELLDANTNMLSPSNCRQAYFDSGLKIGSMVGGQSTVPLADQLLVTAQKVGDNIVKVFGHVPGLKYRWKEGIIAATYDMATSDPLNNRVSDYKELRRDVGLVFTNTPFDNVDSANIVSLLVTGQPYNMSSFITSALNNSTFVTTPNLNSRQDYISTFLSIHQQTVKAHGNFVPFKTLYVDPIDLARSIGLQQQLTGASSEITQMRTQYANLRDQINNFGGNKNSDLKELSSKLDAQMKQLNDKLNKAQADFSIMTKTANDLKDNVLQIAGNDISFELIDSVDRNAYRNFGDKLLYATLRRREDVILNRDSNYLIISDEYDKDYDIQSFVLQMRSQAPDMWNNSWQSTYALCQRVASIINFEFFCSTQGHIVFRPPQYNRTPATVLAAMLSLNYNQGIQVFPDYLVSLFQLREQSVVRDIITLEWEIRMYAALLGEVVDSQVKKLVSGTFGSEAFFLSSLLDGDSQSNAGTRTAIDCDKVLDDQERKRIKSKISSATGTDQKNSHLVSYFSADNQISLQESYLNTKEVSGKEEAYNNAKAQVARLRGQPQSDFPEYEAAKIGASRNGQSTPATDIANCISNIAQLISNRSRLLSTLEKLLDQNIEMGEANKVASTSLSGIKPGKVMSLSAIMPKDIYNRLVEDDTRDIVGHMSSSRFIIRDSDIISSSFVEEPPAMTTVQVTGSEPIFGQGSSNDFMNRIHVAYAADFDTMRQYGWRDDKAIDAPFLWSPDKQCAPYAVMMLSRQRKNIVRGDITVVGNEYYQLGDVVYVACRQMLFYVYGISHSFTYGNKFNTTLKLNYGHAPGEYIPTPLDVIGKMGMKQAKVQNSYRMKRERSASDIVLGTVVFPSGSKDLFGGSNGVKNFSALKSAAVGAQREMVGANEKFNAKLYIVTYSGDSGLQRSRRSAVRSWFQNPYRPGTAANGIGMDGAGGLSVPTSSQLGGEEANDPKRFRVNDKSIEDKHIRQCLQKGEKLNDEEKKLISEGVSASQEVLAIEDPPDNVVEIRLRRAPFAGWPT